MLERENLKKQIRHNRNKNTAANPRSLADLDEIPDLYRRTFAGDNFLLLDSKAYDEVPNGRVIVFATRRNLEVLRECDVWYVDGTFKVSLCQSYIHFPYSSVRKFSVGFTQYLHATVHDFGQCA